ncbi:erythromycin esterase family protein [Streptomyces platensis]|uniref:erythromycin esterase family protein n=1 Tax=Streptomyces platensis TaxID=58346 RepID=UPI002ED50100|nr:erythromycin esterase family protein [Streptomyces platensis]
MLDLVQWLRTHNRDLPADRQVRLIGMDPQRCTDSLEALATYLHQVAPEQAENVRELEPLAQAHPAAHPDPQQALLHRAEALAGLHPPAHQRPSPPKPLHGCTPPTPPTPNAASAPPSPVSPTAST